MQSPRLGAEGLRDEVNPCFRTANKLVGGEKTKTQVASQHATDVCGEQVRARYGPEEEMEEEVW